MSTRRVQDYGKLIDLPTKRKLLSLVQGRHGGLGAGSSHEFLDMEEYLPGDAISDIDWKVTARLRTPIVKRYEKTAALKVILAVDTGANMSALASGDGETAQSKEDVAAEVVLALSWLTAHRGDHLGLVAGNREGIDTLPARSGAGHAQTLVRLATSGTVTGAQADFNAVLRRTDSMRRGRSLVIGVTDLTQIDRVPDKYLKRLSVQHDLLIILVDDADPGTLSKRELVDVAAGPLPEFAATEAVARQWRADRQMRLARVEARLRRLGIGWISLASTQDVPRGLLQLFGGPRARPA